MEVVSSFANQQSLHPRKIFILNEGGIHTGFKLSVYTSVCRPNLEFWQFLDICTLTLSRLTWYLIWINSIGNNGGARVSSERRRSSCSSLVSSNKKRLISRQYWVVAGAKIHAVSVYEFPLAPISLFQTAARLGTENPKLHLISSFFKHPRQCQEISWDFAGHAGWHQRFVKYSKHWIIEGN